MDEKSNNVPTRCLQAYWDLLLAHNFGLNPDKPNEIIHNGCNECKSKTENCAIVLGINGVIIAANSMKVQPNLSGSCLKCEKRMEKLINLVNNSYEKKKIMSLIKAIIIKFDDCPHNCGQLAECSISDYILFLRKAYDEEMLLIKIPKKLAEIYTIYDGIVCKGLYTPSGSQRCVRYALRMLYEIKKIVDAMSVKDEVINKQIDNCLKTFKFIGKLAQIACAESIK